MWLCLAHYVQGSFEYQELIKTKKKIVSGQNWRTKVSGGVASVEKVTQGGVSNLKHPPVPTLRWT
jgi:hypothetical protein